MLCIEKAKRKKIIIREIRKLVKKTTVIFYNFVILFIYLLLFFVHELKNSAYVFLMVIVTLLRNTRLDTAQCQPKDRKNIVCHFQLVKNETNSTIFRLVSGYQNMLTAEGWDTRTKKGVLGMSLNCIWWRDSTSGVLVRVNSPFIVIVLRLLLVSNGYTC